MVVVVVVVVSGRKTGGLLLVGVEDGLSKVEFQRTADWDVDCWVCFCFADNGIPKQEGIE